MSFCCDLWGIMGPLSRMHGISHRHLHTRGRMLNLDLCVTELKFKAMMANPQLVHTQVKW